MKQVAEIVLNWSAIDTMLGYCLGLVRNSEGIPMLPQQAMFEKDISEKVKLLSLLIKAVRLPPDQSALIKEFLAIYGRWGGDRNLVAHGIALQSIEGAAFIHSERKSAGVTVSDLAKYVDRSRFGLHVIMRLNMKLADLLWDPLGPLPARPQ